MLRYLSNARALLLGLGVHLFELLTLIKAVQILILLEMSVEHVSVIHKLVAQRQVAHSALAELTVCFKQILVFYAKGLLELILVCLQFLLRDSFIGFLDDHGLHELVNDHLFVL